MSFYRFIINNNNVQISPRIMFRIPTSVVTVNWSSVHLRFPDPISGNFYSKEYVPVMGGSNPLSLPPSTSQAPSFEEHIDKGQEEKGRKTRAGRRDP
jgi:hypothetical protein